MDGTFATLIQELHRFAKNNQFQRAVIGLSGGLNSSVVLLIAVRVFGPKNVVALLLPETGLTPEDDTAHARALAIHLGAEWHYQPINNFLVDYNFLSWDKTETSNQNLKTRIRANLINNFAEAKNALVLGTACKSDLDLGLGLPEGEFTGSVHPLGDLYKTEVQEIAGLLNLPNELVEKAPSRNLRPNQSDEDDLGAKWGKIDEILYQLDNGLDPENLIAKGMDSLLVHKIARLAEQHKESKRSTQIITIIRIPEAIKKACEAEASSLN
ncbi:MAG: NAD(+) synthase [Candidatus Gracilibacteria bacterium]